MKRMEHDFLKPLPFFVSLFEAEDKSPCPAQLWPGFTEVPRKKDQILIPKKEKSAIPVVTAI